MSTSIGSTGVTFPNLSVQGKPIIGAIETGNEYIKIPKGDGTFWIIAYELGNDIGVGLTTGTWNVKFPYSTIHCAIATVVYNSDPNSTGVAPDTGGVASQPGISDSNLPSGGSIGTLRISTPSASQYWFMNGIFIGSIAV